jgi:hypothetical protein
LVNGRSAAGFGLAGQDMKAQFQPAGNASADEAPRFLTDPSLAPVLAGARARGMADALELLGVAAILVDECGFALHVNARARDLMGPQLRIDAGRLRASERELDAAIGAALESAVAGAVPAQGARIGLAEGARGAAALRILPVVAETDESFQLLRAIVVLEDGGAARDAGCGVLN